MYPDLRFGGPQPTMPTPFSPQSLSFGTAPQPASGMGSYGSMGGYGLLPGPAASVLPQPGVPIAPAPGSAVPALPGAELAPMSRPANLEILDPAAAAGGGWMDGFKGMFTNAEGGWDLSGLGDVAKGIGAFGSLYMGFQQNAQAADALNFQKKAYKTNLENSIGSYNLALEDRITARAAQTGQGDAERDAYINKHKMGR